MAALLCSCGFSKAHFEDLKIKHHQLPSPAVAHPYRPIHHYIEINRDCYQTAITWSSFPEIRVLRDATDLSPEDRYFQVPLWLGW